MSSSVASRAGSLTLSDAKLIRLRPWFYGWRGVLSAISAFIGPPLAGTKKSVRQHLQTGDTNAAMVVQLDPLLVAAYSEDLDAATLLVFPPVAVDTTGLSVGTRLTSVNLYQGQGQPEDDLVTGLGNSGQWSDFSPLIGEFVSDDTARLAELKAAIPPEQWTRLAELAADYRRRNPDRARDGRPGYGGLKKITA